MNKYEAYMIERMASRLESLMAAVERITRPTTEPIHGLSTWATLEPETRNRSQYRIDQERAQNHDPFRAYLGYGQGLRRRS